MRFCAHLDCNSLNIYRGDISDKISKEKHTLLPPYVPYGSHNKQRLFPQTALTGWAL
jgi:hypothetical protein